MGRWAVWCLWSVWSGGAVTSFLPLIRSEVGKGGPVAKVRKLRWPVKVLVFWGVLTACMSARGVKRRGAPGGVMAGRAKGAPLWLRGVA